MQGYSFVNYRHISHALDLAHDLHTSLSVALEDIVILTGYEDQRRAYMEDQVRRQHAHLEVKWMDIGAHVIKSVFPSRSPTLRVFTYLQAVYLCVFCLC
jgi:hypothetical protein